MKTTISSITVCLNNKQGVFKTLKSLYKQKSIDYEVIVIDGGSIDGTIEVLNKFKILFEKKGVPFKYISESDSGIYNAMNKGITLASGQWMIFMNSGDFYASNDIFEKIVPICQAEYDIIYGDWMRLGKNGKPTYQKAKPLRSFMTTIPTRHQSFFIRSSLLKKRGYDEKYRICADYDWLLKAYLHQKKFFYVPIAICIFDMYGISHKQIYKTYCETKRIEVLNGVCKDSKAVLFVKKMIWFCISRIKAILC